MTTYHERLYVPLRWWVQAVMLIATFWMALVVAVPERWAWAVTGALLALVTLAFWAYGSARIVVDGEGLRVGNARIEARWIGAIEPLEAEQARLVAGRDADVRAFLLLRPYLKRAVRISITDPADPAPYWLVSTRRPAQLAAAVQAQTGATSER